MNEILTNLASGIAGAFLLWLNRHMMNYKTLKNEKLEREKEVKEKKRTTTPKRRSTQEIVTSEL